MVKKKRSQHDLAFQALRTLMVEPGDELTPWNDLLGNHGPDRLKTIIAETPGALPRYNDRDAALVYAAMLEHALELAVASCFVSDPAVRERLFSYSDDGPLATFQAKIDVGHALGLFGALMRKDMWRIKAIRNAFAHARTGVTFSDERIANACQFIDVSKNLRADLGGPRQRYTFAVGVISAFLKEIILSSPHEKMASVYSTLYDEPLPSPRRQ